MQRTKSMVYRPTEEARELTIVTTTSRAKLYREQIVPLINRCHYYLEKGKFDKEKAIDGFYRIATESSKEYNRDFGYSFSVQDRFTTACDLLDYFMEDIEQGIEV